MKYKCIIFDFDGTLANTEIVILNIYNELARKYGYKEVTHEYIEKVKRTALPNIVKDLEIPYTKALSLLKKGQKIMKEYHTLFEVYEQDLKEIIEKLKSLVEYIGIISSNTKKTINKFLTNEDIPELDFIISSPLFTKEKKINKIKKKLKLASEEILYVGDEIRDIISAKKAGIDIASVTYGYNTKEFLATENPTYFIDSLKELIDIVLNKK